MAKKDMLNTEGNRRGSLQGNNKPQGKEEGFPERKEHSHRGYYVHERLRQERMPPSKKQNEGESQQTCLERLAPFDHEVKF